MAYTTVYSRINWENEPSINTPINATNLNAIDYAVYVHDQTLSNWDLTKANETDLLLCVKEITYDSDTGEFLFTWQNGTTLAVDLNIEKIPVSFSMSPQGVITMTTEDGTQYTADVGSLIKTYSFTDSSVIDFTVITDASGNKTVTADIVDGSITGTKLQPNYLADCVSAKTDAETAEGLAEDSAEDSEAWANGTRNGVPVTSSDPAYHNNSKYWSEQSNPTTLVGLTDTDINNPTNGQTLIYNSTSQKWENQNGGSASLAGLSDVDLTTPTDGQVLTYDFANQEWVNADIGASGGSNITVTTTEATLYGQNVTISDGVTTLTETFSPSGVALFEGVTMTGQLIIASGAFSTTVNVPYFGNYNPILSGFTATITVTFPANSTCSCGKTGETPQTASVSPHTFTVHSVGIYTITATDGTHTKSDTVTITTDGQSESVTLTYVPDGSTVLPTDDIQIWLNCADIYDKTSYTTLSDILSDSTTLSALIADNNAVDYMARSKSWASDWNDLCTEQTYTFSGSTSTDVALNNANGVGKFRLYMTSQSSNGAGHGLKLQLYDSNNTALVPNMTSATAPSGTVSQSGQISYYEAWRGFSTSQSNGWFAQNSIGYGADDYIGYEFTSAVNATKATVSMVNANSTTLHFKIQKYETAITEDSTAMSYIGLNNYCANTLLADSDWLNAICNSAYFESVLNVKVPVMTSDNTPSGNCFASTTYGANYEAYRAFRDNFSGVGGSGNCWQSANGSVTNQRIGYEFASPQKIKAVAIGNTNYPTSSIATFRVEAEVNGSWTSLTDTLTNDINVTTKNVFMVPNTSAYAKWSVYALTNGGGTAVISANTIQFYGRQDV